MDTTARPVALITGAGSGIGQAVAIAMLGEGYRVVLAGRQIETLQSTIDAAGATGENALAVPTDVADENSVRSLFASIQSTFGRLDVLFNNAGTGAPAIDFDELTLAQWQSVVDVNLTGAFLCARESYRMMKSQNPRGGRIINNGSISATTPRPNSAPYTATKHAVAGLTKSLALDGRKHDIACGQIDIGNADTELAAKMRHGTRQADGSTSPEPTIDVELVARSVVHMASLPLDANVLTMTVMATKMPFVGRG